jgi:sugar fermentation stimulation protein A
MDDSQKAGLSWPRLISGTLINRYKRFIADIRLNNGNIIAAHCPNSGRMTECCEPNRPVWVSLHDRPERKLKYTWELIEMPTSLVGVNTQIPNRLVHLSIQKNRIAELAGYDRIKREVTVDKTARIDLLLEHPGRKKCLVEIKNCTLVKNQKAFFPDAVTARGLKHIRALEKMINAGYRSVMFFLIQRMDAESFAPADFIDPEYGQALRSAAANGLEILAYDVHINLDRIILNKKIPICLYLE